MKQINHVIGLILLLISMTTVPVMAQQELFDKFADRDGVTSVYISKAMFQMMSGIETASLNLANMKGKVESLQVLATEKPELKEEIRKAFQPLIGKPHEELMRVKSDKTKANFYMRKKGDLIQELIMLADTGDEFAVVQLLGNFTLKDIQEITESVQ